MIVLVRIDDRLLHGQIAYSWKSALKYDAIIVANSSAANDEIRKGAIKLAVPSGVRLAVREVESACELTKNEKLVNMKVLVIVGSTEDALTFYQNIDEKPVLNVGGIQKGEDKRVFSKAVYMKESDIENLDMIEKLGVEIQVQEIPSTTSYKYVDLREKFLEGGSNNV